MGSSWSMNTLMAAGLCLCLGAVLISGCSSQPLPGEGQMPPAEDGAGRDAPVALPGPAIAAETPPSPVARPGAQAQSPPGPAPRPTPAQEEAAAQRRRAFEADLSVDTLDRVKEGMSFQEVSELVGRPGVTVASDGLESTLYRWSTGEHSFLAKFENGRLTRKTLMAPPDPHSAGPELTQDAYDLVSTGMDLQEVLELLELPPQPVARQGEAVAIYRWSDGRGSSFTGRFENGQLVRKTAFVVAPLARDEETEGEGAREERDEAAEEEGEAREAVVQIAEAPAQPVSEQETWEERPPATRPAQQEVESAPTPSRVRVIGADRRDREAAADSSPDQGRSYRPKRRLPEYTWSIPRGAYEIRVKNPANDRVQIGIRSGRYGKDLNLRPNGESSIFVGQGAYRIHYIYDADPDTLYRGGEFRIDGAFTADVEVTILERDYSVQHLNDDGGYRRRR